MRREVFLSLVSAALATSACDSSDEQPGYLVNKGCYPHNCEYRPSNAPPPDDAPTGTRWSPPDGCPKSRPNDVRASLTPSEVRAVLPGRYRSCFRDEEIELSPETIVVGACVDTRCDVYWNDEYGSLQLWSEPTAFAFTADEFGSDDWVRVGE